MLQLPLLRQRWVPWGSGRHGAVGAWPAHRGTVLPNTVTQKLESK